MSSKRIRLGRAHVLARVRRFASLRAAERAIVPSLRSTEDLPARGRLRELRDRLQALHDQTKQDACLHVDISQADLTVIDDSLEATARGLRAALKGISMPQLRSTLDPAEGDQRREAVALLDLCLEDEDNLGEWLQLSDLLITHLSTADCDGMRTVVNDPADLSPLLRELCTKSEGGNRQDHDAAIAYFCSAAERVRTGEGLDATIREVSAHKRRLGLVFFAPEVLRCVVFYNVTVGNQRAEALLGERAENLELDAESGLAAVIQIR